MPGDVVVVRGTGSIGRRHLRAFAALPDVAAMAYPLRPERVSELAAEGFSAVTNLEGLGPITGAVVATDTARHIGDTKELLAAGPVLVEKPAAPSATGLQALATHARELGRGVWVAFCLRFDPSLVRFAECVAEIGPIDSVRIECQSYLPSWRPADDHRRSYSARADEGGVLRDLAHEIDYATMLYGRPSAVFATLTRTGRLEIESEEGADLLWTAGNAVVSLRLDYLSRVPRRRMRASGAGGEVEWDALAQRVTIRTGNGEERIEHVSCDRDEMFRRQAAAFVAACHGKPSGRLATLEEGSFVAALSDAARRSASSGRIEPIEPVSA